MSSTQSAQSAPSTPSVPPASDPTEFNKKTMVEYMMLTNKAFEHCIDTTMSDTEGILGAVKKDLNLNSGTEIKLDLKEILSRLKNGKNKLNSPNKTISTRAVEGILYTIIQHCLGDKKTSEYTPYQKNVIQNIIFNILKKEIINDFETFLLLGIINKISSKKEKITLAHVDTLIYMLDKLFLYRFPSIYVNDSTFKLRKQKYINNKGKTITIEAKTIMPKNSDTLPDIYNRYLVYEELEKLKDSTSAPASTPITTPNYHGFESYFKLYEIRMKENVFPENLITYIKPPAPAP